MSLLCPRASPLLLPELLFLSSSLHFMHCAPGVRRTAEPSHILSANVCPQRGIAVTGIWVPASEPIIDAHAVLASLPSPYSLMLAHNHNYYWSNILWWVTPRMCLSLHKKSVVCCERLIRPLMQMQQILGHFSLQWIIIILVLVCEWRREDERRIKIQSCDRVFHLKAQWLGSLETIPSLVN